MANLGHFGCGFVRGKSGAGGGRRREKGMERGSVHTLVLRSQMGAEEIRWWVHTRVRWWKTRRRRSRAKSPWMRIAVAGWIEEKKDKSPVPLEGEICESDRKTKTREGWVGSRPSDRPL